MATLRPSDYAAAFRWAPTAMLILDPDLRIRDANEAYLAATGRPLDDLVGRDVFDAFPANPHHPEGDGVENLHASLRRVLETRQTHHMWVQRYDVPWQGAPGGFLERYWSPTNAPILDADGELVGILHVVADVTGFHDDLGAALEFYRAEIRAEGEQAEESDRRFAEYAKVATSNARRYLDVVTEVEQLREALTSRATIDQAKGILMLRHGCGPDRAFALLVDRSKSTNTKLRDVAAELVAEVTRGGRPDGA
jgi:PAS domain S-box-containing protein